jgi:hypothetical protein
MGSVVAYGSQRPAPDLLVLGAVKWVSRIMNKVDVGSARCCNGRVLCLHFPPYAFLVPCTKLISYEHKDLYHKRSYPCKKKSKTIPVTDRGGP